MLYLRQLNEEKLEREQENMLVGRVIAHYLSSYAERDLYRQAAFIVLLEQLGRTLMAILSASGGELSGQTERLLVTAYISRYFEHANRAYMDSFDTMLRDKQMLDIDFLSRLVS